MDEDVMNELLKNVILAQTRDQIEASYDSIRLPGTPQLPGPQLGA